MKCRTLWLFHLLPLSCAFHSENGLTKLRGSLLPQAQPMETIHLSKVKFLLNVGLLQLCLSFDWLLILLLQRNKSELLERTLILNCAQTD